MKKFIMIFFVFILFSSCNYNWSTGTYTKKLNSTDLLSVLPIGFEYIKDVGHSWYLCYQKETGYYLVSIQGSGSAGTFVQMTWIGNKKD